MATTVSTEKMTAGVKKYWLEDLAGGKQFKCAKCIPCFNDGKDECNGCGFDMNTFNKKEEEDKEEEEEEECMS